VIYSSGQRVGGFPPIGCGAVVFLWQRPSSAFFAQASLTR